jgi:hypothetical protein
MKKIAGAVLLLGSLATAACGRSSGPGSKSSVTAYEPDGTTVIKFEPCGKVGRAYDYPSCGSKLRADVAALMCTRGKGRQEWLYQIGSGKPLPQTTLCK